jgi:hypothetical protein
MIYKTVLQKKTNALVVWLLTAMLVFGCSTVVLATGPADGTPTSQDEFKTLSVCELTQQAGVLDGRLVATYGIVDKYDPVREGAVRAYFLKGDEGCFVRINTVKEVPALNERLYVKGVVRVEGDASKEGFFLHEEFRRTDDKTTTLPPKPKPKQWWEEHQDLLIAGGVVLVLLILLLLFLKRRSSSTPTSGYASPGSMENLADVETAGAVGGAAQQVNQDQPAPAQPMDDFEITIKEDSTIVRGLNDKTVKFLPGHLEIITGGQAGDKLPLCGGNNVTVGRYSGKPHGPNFIALDDTSRALSRTQAKISYDDRSERFMLEHDSKAANPTLVDGSGMGPGEARELKDGMEISLPGNFTLCFKVGTFIPS